MTQMDAIILAGEKEGSIPVMGKNKALLSFRGRPLIRYVIDAVDRAETINSITIVGPRNKLETELAGYKTEKPLNFLEQGRNIFENIWQGTVSTFPEYRPGITSEELKGSPQADKAVVLLTCDMPMLEPLEIDRFVSAAPLDRADFVCGVTRHEMLEPYEPRGETPGIKFIYFCLRDRLIRHSNIFCMRPLKLAHVVEDFMPRVYNLRYQRHLRKVLSATAQFLWFFATRPGPLALFFLLESASYCHNHNLHRLRQILRRPIELEWAERITSEIFETRVATLETIGPGPTLDVDDEESYNAFVAMYDKWKEMQLEQLKSAGI